jgi:type VI secretion system protein ImpH
VSERLFREPFRFDFFQAVRLLEHLERARAEDDPARRRHRVGEDRAPAQEIVRFRALPALSFPAGAVSQLRQDGEAGRPPEMVVSFMGLTGPSGVLPQHYTTLLMQRLRSKDASLRDFLDLFNHRVLSLFYRAWEKYRFPMAHERARREGPRAEPDLFTQALYCLVGLGTAGLRGRLAAGDAPLLFYGGLFAHFPRPAVGLEGLLAEHFGLPVAVEQFQGQWLALGEDDSTQLASSGWPLGRNTQLGADTVAGDRIWDVTSKVRLRLGPMTYEQFQRLLPTGADWPALVGLARTYLGPDLDFDLQLVLGPLEAPWWQLAGDDDQGGSRLGWDLWVRSHDFLDDVEDVVLPTDAA